jgi:hypothetical protein
VGDGECFALADQALRHAGARSASYYGEITDDGDYVWGDPVELKEVVPGDILQFRDFDIDTITETKRKLQGGGEEDRTNETIAKRGHHTAIVEYNLHNGRLVILEQHVKPLGSKVQRHTIPISSPDVVHDRPRGKAKFITTTIVVTGSIKAFHPHPAERRHKHQRHH